jgi:hypothetical protein
MAICLCLPLLLACEENSIPTGTYTFQASSVVTTVDDDQTCGLLGLPSDGYDATFIVRRKSDHVVYITEKVTSCQFEAQVNGHSFSANAAECTSTNDATFHEAGLYRELFQEFAVDIERASFHATSEHWQKVNAGSGHSCAVTEGRLVNYQSDTQ